MIEYSNDGFGSKTRKVYDYKEELLKVLKGRFGSNDHSKQEAHVSNYVSNQFAQQLNKKPSLSIKIMKVSAALPNRCT